MSLKKVQVEVRQGSGFKTECRSGKHMVIIDQPAPAGGDEGPSPLEIQLMALGACITAIGRITANQRRLQVRGISVSLEGELDTDRLAGKPTNARTGFSSIVARTKIDADLPPAEKEQLLREIEGRCPVSENLKNPTPVKLVLG